MNTQPSTNRKCLCQVRLLLSKTTHTLAALVDSGAEANIMEIELAHQLGLESHWLPSPVPAQALDGLLLGTVTSVTAPILTMLSGNHQETIRFHLLHSLGQPLILDNPWLCQHNPLPRLDDRDDQGVGKRLPPDLLACCHVAPDISNVPECYHSLREVFNKARATSLPPHWPYNLLPGTTH